VIFPIVCLNKHQLSCAKVDYSVLLDELIMNNWSFSSEIISASVNIDRQNPLEISLLNLQEMQRVVVGFSQWKIA